MSFDTCHSTEASSLLLLLFACCAACVPAKCDDRACQAGVCSAGVCSYTLQPDGTSCVDGPVPGKCRIGEPASLSRAVAAHRHCMT
jgi:hypothetical protein